MKDSAGHLKKILSLATRIAGQRAEAKTFLDEADRLELELKDLVGIEVDVIAVKRTKIKTKPAKKKRAKAKKPRIAKVPATFTRPPSKTTLMVLEYLKRRPNHRIKVADLCETLKIDHKSAWNSLATLITKKLAVKDGGTYRIATGKGSASMAPKGLTLDVISLLEKEKRPLTITEVSEKTGAERSRVSSVLYRNADKGVLKKTGEGEFKYANGHNVGVN